MGGGQVPLPNPISAGDVVAVAPVYGVDPFYFLRVTLKADELYIAEATKRAERAIRRKSKSR